ncbi:MAG: agmatine deiminase family protein [Phycisphaeraceae bacterium]|nr:MAG: agmatine deiminase family protein [Phycisphaeraceae bacterium]
MHPIVLAALAPFATLPIMPDDGSPLPRDLTPAEAAWVAANPIRAEGLRGDTPTGPIHCTGEYEPVEGLLLAYEGTASWLSILNQMAAKITTVGDANVYVMCDTVSEQTTARNAMVAAGADTNRVFTFVHTTDTIWIRDYGPRYIYEGNGGPNHDQGVRAIVDHTYNRPRPNDNATPQFWADVRGETHYQIPLVHGGGNYHLSALTDSYATRLIANENPGLTESDIIQLWHDYQGVNTTINDPFPTSVDSTQHIDMWMEIPGDRAVVIGDYPLAPGSTHDQICDARAAAMAAAGYAVTRVPNIGNPGATHYTFTNVVVCNDIVLLPYYDGVAQTYNDQALAAWQAATPDKQIIQIDCDAIVTSAGVMHCIVMHVPVCAGGANPVAWITSPNGAGSYNPGDEVAVTWRSDDDTPFFGRPIASADLLLSTDGGATFQPQLTGLPNTGSATWTVPALATSQGVLRVLLHDADGNTGYDDTDGLVTITSPACNPADIAAPFGVLDLADVQTFIAGFVAGDLVADIAVPFGVLDLADVQAFIGAFVAGCP